MGSGFDKNGNFIDILEAKAKSGESFNMYFIIQHAAAKMFLGRSPEEVLKSYRMKDSVAKYTAAPIIGNDGSSYEKAIVIQADNSEDGIDEEYVWLGKHYPDFKIIMQILSEKNGRKYDELLIETLDGQGKTIYFDISNFSGK